MDDLTATRLCAAAIGAEVVRDLNGEFLRLIEPPHTALSAAHSGRYYNPLAEDAQAMALLWYLISTDHKIAFEAEARGGNPIGICDTIVGPTPDAKGLRKFIVYCVAATWEAKNAR